MSAQGQAIHCPPGQVLFRPDDECRGFVIVRKGTIRVSLTAPNGREIVLYRVGPGDVCLQTFACLIERRRYSAEGIVETALEGELVPPADFKRLIVEDADFREAMLRSVAHRFEDFEQLVEDVALTGFEARLARALLRLADGEGVVHATHETLAVETGSGRAVVSRQLGEFVRSGLVALARGTVSIRDRRGLEFVSENVT